MPVQQGCLTTPSPTPPAGDLTFNPEKDTLIGANGQEITLTSPHGEELPSRGFDAGAPLATLPLNGVHASLRACEFACLHVCVRVCVPSESCVCWVLVR